MNGIVNDWQMLKDCHLEYNDDAEAHFFKTLDVGEAIAFAATLADDKRRIEAMKAELEPEIETEPERDEVPPELYEPEIEYAQQELQPAAPNPAKPIPAPPMAAQPLPEEDKGRVIADISAMLEWYPLPRLKNLRTALMNGRTVSGTPKQRVMVLDAAYDCQLEIIGKLCGLVGVTGVFKCGTLAEVVRQECDRAAHEAREAYQIPDVVRQASYQRECDEAAFAAREAYPYGA